LFVGRDRALLFDTGINSVIPQHVLPYLVSIGLPLEMIELVVVSHCDVDHFGGIEDAHDFLPCARVLAHELDADAMESFDAYERDRGRSLRTAFGFDEGTDEWARSVVREGRVDRRLTGDESIDLGDRTVNILHLPGHSRGHLSVYDADNSVIAISDAILGDAVPFSSGKPAFPPTYRHERTYLESIERVRSLGAEWVATAHYGLFDGVHASAFLDSSRDFAVALRARVLAMIRTSAAGVGLEALAVQLNPVVGSWPKGGSVAALVVPIAAHLEQLESEGIIRRDVRGNPAIAWFLDSR